MKKVFLSLAAVAVLTVVSCKKADAAAEAPAEAVDTTATEVVADTAAVDTAAVDTTAAATEAPAAE